jgi:hypothetical protein
MASVTLDKILENRPLQASDVEQILEHLRAGMALLDVEVMVADAANLRTGDDRRLEWATTCLRRLSDAEQALLGLAAVCHGPDYGLRQPALFDLPAPAPEPEPSPAVWHTREGHEVLVRDMSDRHLDNAIAMIERKMRRDAADSVALATLDEETARLRAESARWTGKAGTEQLAQLRAERDRRHA